MLKKTIHEFTFELLLRVGFVMISWAKKMSFVGSTLINCIISFDEFGVPWDPPYKYMNRASVQSVATQT